MTQEPPASITNPRTFFVVGHIKSGLTWVQHLLNEHPQVACTGEGHFTDQLYPSARLLVERYNSALVERHKMLGHGTPYPKLTSDDALFVAAELCRRQIQRQASLDKDITWIGEKTPEHAHRVSLLTRLVPDARFVEVIRDGRDAAVSGWCHALSVAPAWLYEKYGDISNYTREFARRWRRSVRSLKALRKRHPARVVTVRYESLLDDAATELARILDFLCLNSSSDEDIARCVQAASFETLSGGRSNGEEHPSSFFRKGVAGDWRAVLPKTAVEAFLEEAEATLLELGYPVPTQSASSSATRLTTGPHSP